MSPVPASERPTPVQPLERERVRDRERESDRLRDRQVSLPISTLMTLLAAVGGGATAGNLGDSRTATAVRELELKFDARLGSLERELQRQAEDSRADMARLEREADIQRASLKALELWRAREEARRDPPAAPR